MNALKHAINFNFKGAAERLIISAIKTIAASSRENMKALYDLAGDRGFALLINIGDAELTRICETALQIVENAGIELDRPPPR